MKHVTFFCDNCEKELEPYKQTLLRIMDDLFDQLKDVKARLKKIERTFDKFFGNDD